MPDTAVISSAEALLDCFKAELAKNPDPPQHLQFRVGSDPVAADFDEVRDYCCEGLAYLRVLRRFPGGEQWPIADEASTNCQPAAWGVDFELGVFRCAPTEPKHMDPDAWLDTFVNVQNDQFAIYEAFCCWIDQQDANNPLFMNFMIRDWRPFALMGGCTGGAATVQGQFGAGKGNNG